MSAGPSRASSRANTYGDERPRVSGPNGSFRSEKADSYRKGPSPQPGSQYASTSHKRTASGNPRPASRTAEERRYEERRVTEHTYETHLRRLVPRNTSPDREVPRAAGEKKSQDAPRHRQSESRPKAEIPQGSAPMRDLQLQALCQFLYANMQ